MAAGARLAHLGGVTSGALRDNVDDRLTHADELSGSTRRDWRLTVYQRIHRGAQRGARIEAAASPAAKPGTTSTRVSSSATSKSTTAEPAASSIGTAGLTTPPTGESGQDLVHGLIDDRFAVDALSLDYFGQGHAGVLERLHLFHRLLGGLRHSGGHGVGQPRAAESAPKKSRAARTSAGTAARCGAFDLAR
ncbi:MAG: hypothetical protein OXU21_04520 [Chloroflexota bacterium]|nr:hypothetical protein [Chloroflexota bacterium]